MNADASEDANADADADADARAEERGDAYAVEKFEEFWPYYVRLHKRRETQVLHAVATVSCVGLLVAAAVMRQPLLALAAPLADYVIAQVSHRVFEANRTTPWKNQLWHTRAELRMLGFVVTGRMGGEVERVLGRERGREREREAVPETGR